MALCRKRCHCTHRILVPRGALVEMVLVNEMKGEGAEGHPVHLHGEHFAVVGMAKVRVCDGDVYVRGHSPARVTFCSVWRGQGARV